MNGPAAPRDSRPPRTGRPLRALALLGLALLVWIAVRLPYMAGNMATTLAALRPLPAPGNPPPRLLARAAVHPMPVLVPVSMPVSMPSLVPPLVPPPPGARARLEPPPRPVLGPVARAAAILPAPEPPAKTSLAPPGLPATPPAITGFSLAARAYAQLAAGNRRAAARLFDAALALDPDPRWRRDSNSVRRHWSADAYVLFRDAGPAAPAATPILGGGQSGASLAYTIDPLARRRLAIIGRINTANSEIGTAQAAVGLRWNVRNGVNISAERLIAVGDQARGDWTLRLAAGSQDRLGPAVMTTYGEAGLLGGGDFYAGAQARAALPVTRIGAVAITAGPAAWASLQTGTVTSHRIDIGPSLAAHIPAGRLNLDLSADWRIRIDGNAAPGSGPAVTLSTGF